MPKKKPAKSRPYIQAYVRISHPKAELEEMGINFVLLAQALGVDAVTVRRWFMPYKDSTSRMPSAKDVYRVAVYLGITMEQVMYALGTGRIARRHSNRSDSHNAE